MKFVLLVIVCLIMSACGPEGMPVVKDPTVKAESTPKPPLELIDLTKIPPRDKSRFQLGESANGEPNPVAAEIVANGKASIPFLISKLEDETEMDRTIQPFWYKLYVGDVALMILFDLFSDETEMHSTVPGFQWDDFLERGDDKNLMGEEVLRRYIRKHGRSEIRHRWQEMWEKNKDQIFWDEKCYCFKLRSS